jgi:hypothetical protein
MPMQKYLTTFLLIFTVVFNVSIPAYCLDTDNAQPDKRDDTSSSVEIPIETPAPLPNQKRKKITLYIRINTPHNLRAVDTCRVYPYPVAPPKRKGKISEIGITDASLKTTLRAVGYTAVTNADRPYPSGGMRVQYAFKKAVANSGISLPHNIFTMYVWEDNMIPYMRTEVKKINKIEEERDRQYLAAQKMVEDHKSDLELEAFNSGLFPHDVFMHPWHGDRKSGSVELEQTNWWIVALHKTPGLKYYWLWPVRLSDAPEQVVELNEENAIHIEGGW